jgi:hypothetical protein
MQFLKGSPQLNVHCQQSVVLVFYCGPYTLESELYFFDLFHQMLFPLRLVGGQRVCYSERYWRFRIQI